MRDRQAERRDRQTDRETAIEKQKHRNTDTRIERWTDGKKREKTERQKVNGKVTGKKE